MISHTSFRRLAALLLIALVSGCAETDKLATSRQTESEAVRASRRGVDWLLTRQHDDGAWRSETYGQMRGGAANTALIVYALAHLPDRARDHAKPAIDRAVRFLISNLHEHGFVQNADGSSDYPAYATALLLTALERMKTDEWKRERARMRDYLIASQQTEQHGIGEGHRAFGGWHQTGGDPREPVPRGRTNVSVTRFALEALQASGGVDTNVRDAALKFLSRCQHMPSASRDARAVDYAALRDGGFFFTPSQGDILNKAGGVEIGTEVWLARTYGSATADGLAALAACGVPADDARCRAAAAWLARHDELRFVPGFRTANQRDAITRGNGDPSMRDGLLYYYLAALSRAPTPHPEDRRARLVKILSAAQKPDGSWQNPSNAMREDDPLIATAFALIAVSR